VGLEHTSCYLVFLDDFFNSSIHRRQAITGEKESKKKRAEETSDGGR